MVGGSVVQPKAFHEAMSTIAKLELSGANYSVGLAQINKKNFSKYGLDAAQALDACTNLKGSFKDFRCVLRKSAKKKEPEASKLCMTHCLVITRETLKPATNMVMVNKVRNSAGLQAQVPPLQHQNKEFAGSKHFQAFDFLVITTDEGTYF